MNLFHKERLPNGRRHIYFCGIKILSYKKHKKTNVEYIILSAGICNRIKGLFSFLRTYHIANKKILMFWEKEGTSVNKNFYDLFDFNFPLLQEISKQQHGLIPLPISWRLLLKKGELKESFRQTYHRNPNYPDLPTIDLEYNRIPEYIRDLYLPYFRLLKPSKTVASRIKGLNVPSEYVAVHIRISKEWADWNRGGYEQLPLFIKAMKKYPKDTMFFLASFDSYVSKIIKENFPNRVLELPDKDLESSIDAVAELYLLAGGKELIATYGSTFSEVAWWLSDCSQKVIVVGKREYWKNNGLPDGVVSKGA